MPILEKSRIRMFSLHGQEVWGCRLGAQNPGEGYGSISRGFCADYSCALAMTSLPVPLSPKRSTGAREREILVIWRRICETCEDSPTNPCREPAIGDNVNRLNDIVRL